jgi:hypothetical protein
VYYRQPVSYFFGDKGGALAFSAWASLNGWAAARPCGRRNRTSIRPASEPHSPNPSTLKISSQGLQFISPKSAHLNHDRHAIAQNRRFKLPAM